MELDYTIKAAMEVVMDEGSKIAQWELSYLGVQADRGENVYDKAIIQNKDVEEEVKVYLLSGKYPDQCKSKEEKTFSEEECTVCLQ